MSHALLELDSTHIPVCPCELVALAPLVVDASTQHETTDTDETEFRPPKVARDGKEHAAETIPDGFYRVGDETNPQCEWHAAMIIAVVKQVTHIAPPMPTGKLSTSRWYKRA